MRTIPPFVENSSDNVHCVNAVFRMLLLHFKHEDMSWEEIDRATFASPGKGTWTIGGDLLLAKRGVKVTNIEPVDYRALQKEGAPYLDHAFGADVAEYYKKKSNILDILEQIDEFLSLVRHETRKVDLADIIRALVSKSLVGVTVNTALLNKATGFSLHYILVYDYDGTHFYFHDPGLPPHPSRTITKEKFLECFAFPGANGGIDIFHE